jgi:tRNA threonylcarbamoyladenosine biosynthesis protein TsaB
MTVLGIETSTAVCSVGLSRLDNNSIGQTKNPGSLTERSIVESHIHSEKLLTLISELCESQNVMLSELDGIAVSIGPGSFTGLRIGLSTAKGLCYSLAKPIIAVPTFEAIAASVFFLQPEFIRVIVSIDAKQGESYRSVYELSEGGIRQSHQIQIQNISEVVVTDYEKTIVVTDYADLAKKLYAGSVQIEDVFNYCRGDIVADLAIKKLQAGEINVMEDLEPLYLKDFVVRSHVKMN